MQILQSRTYRLWYAKLRDRRVRDQIAVRLSRLASGLIGDVAFVGEGVRELRIHAGAGYRIYYLEHGGTVVVLLCGGDKGSQKRDIEKAHELARQWRRDHG